MGNALVEVVNYRKNVNQQLASAAFQLSLLDNESHSLSKLQQGSCKQAALHHLLMAMQTYINEILTTYKRDPINFETIILSVVFKKNSLQAYSIVEFNELSRWFEKEGNLLSHLLSFQNDLLKEPVRSNKSENIIVAVVAENTVDLLSDIHAIKQLKFEITTLIDRQRESLQEH